MVQGNLGANTLVSFHILAMSIQSVLMEFNSHLHSATSRSLLSRDAQTMN
jgi:hypothetical protein